MQGEPLEHLATRRQLLLGAGAGLVLAPWLGGCANALDTSAAAPRDRAESKDQLYRAVNRLTWGASGASLREASASGFASYLEGQLRAQGRDALPPSIQSQIDAMRIQQTSLQTLVWELEATRKAADAIASEDGRKVAQQSYQQELNRLGRECANRHVLRALYSERQLLEHMTWFWMNHFNVHQYKANLRAMLGDYEERAIRPHALGSFRSLLAAATRHPAMLRYLDNDQNAAGHINENHARELLELHTLGVDGGYQQRDVQEMARVLTGFGVNVTDAKPNVRAEWQQLYLRDGLFEFNPNRHDFGAKTVLGHAVRGRGATELDEMLDVIVHHPSTSRFIARQMAQYLLADEPIAALVEKMAQAFRASDGQIGATLRVLVRAPEFVAASTQKFKDPMHFVVSAVRASYDEKPILNAAPMQNWLNRSGEALYNRQTPDGYPLTAGAWTSSGQMSTRFEIAKAIGTGSAGLFKAEDTAAQPAEVPAFPTLMNPVYYELMRTELSANTRAALDRAGSPQEWNALYLSSPEFMYR